MKYRTISIADSENWLNRSQAYDPGLPGLENYRGRAFRRRSCMYMKLKTFFSQRGDKQRSLWFIVITVMPASILPNSLVILALRMFTAWRCGYSCWKKNIGKHWWSLKYGIGYKITISWAQPVVKNHDRRLPVDFGKPEGRSDVVRFCSNRMQSLSYWSIYGNNALWAPVMPTAATVLMCWFRQESTLIIKKNFPPLELLPWFLRSSGQEKVVEQLLALTLIHRLKTYDDFTALGFSLYQKNTYYYPSLINQEIEMEALPGTSLTHRFGITHPFPYRPYPGCWKILHGASRLTSGWWN